MSAQTAFDLYHRLVQVIDKATAEKSIYDVPAAAEIAHMDGGQTHTGSSERWAYTFTDARGETVNLHCRWYDQSQIFSPAADMHKMSVELRGPRQLLSHSAKYEE